jgi:hypothetical protein
MWDLSLAGARSPKRSGPAQSLAQRPSDRVALGEHLTADFNAQSYGGRLEGGYRFDWQQLTDNWRGIAGQKRARTLFAQMVAMNDGWRCARRGLRRVELAKILENHCHRERAVHCVLPSTMTIDQDQDCRLCLKG